MKKTISLLLSFLLILPLFCACGEEETVLTVGFVTDSGPVNDYSINEAIWNGVVLASSVYGTDGVYSVPTEKSTDAFRASVDGLYSSGCRVILVPDYSFESVVLDARSAYKDCIFVCVGFTPSKFYSNVTSIGFAENEAAFLAGIAAAQQLKTGAFGAVFGMDIPSARKYSGGFKYGVEYANKNLGTAVTLNEENIIYAGSYNDPELGAKLAAGLYGAGVSCIFTDGGKTAEGVFETAKQLRGVGNDVWVIGSGIDCYNQGIYEGNRSVTLTSAVSRISSSVCSVIGSISDGTFTGGSQLMFDAVTDGVGIPSGDANLSPEIRENCETILKMLSDGLITVPDEWNELFE